MQGRFVPLLKARPMYVYIITEPGLFTVGYHTPDGRWIAVEDFTDSVKAADRVAYLNGGRTPEDHIRAALEQIERQIAEQRAAIKAIERILKAQ